MNKTSTIATVVRWSASVAPVVAVMVMQEFTEGQGRAEARTPGYKWG